MCADCSHAICFCLCFGMCSCTVEPLLKDTPNKGHSTFCIKDKFCGPYRKITMQFHLFKRTTSLYSKITPKLGGPSVHYLEVPLYILVCVHVYIYKSNYERDVPIKTIPPAETNITACDRTKSEQ